MLYLHPKMYKRAVSWLKSLSWLTNCIYKAHSNEMCSMAKEFRECQLCSTYHEF